ncbi:MAG: pyruvate kinase [Acidimicrobiia bacterium]|nr:MAG: pyruvate kinase [Acidimicrobiia bacterium]
MGAICSKVGSMRRKTKIVATLGPATESPDVVVKLIERGMNVARLNFSHGSHADHERRFAVVRQCASDVDRPIAIMQDIQGPKIRVGTFSGGSVELLAGSTIRLHEGEGVGDAENIKIVHLDCVEISVGGKVILADGLIELEATNVDRDGVTATVLQAGELLDHKGASFPGARTSLPAVTDKDAEDLEFGLSLGFDMVAASFVNSGDDIRSVREIVGDQLVIAKIETAVGYMNLDDILEEADGAMVARGDLGVELSIESVPRAQYEIIHRANAAGKISITATEMLESMITHPRPTRAEVSDVYRSVLDGTDAVMLSAETAIGEFPTRAVKLMASICSEAERSTGFGRATDISNLSEGAAFASATAEASVDTADRLGLDTIVAFTESGTTARLLSKYRSKADVYAFTPVERTYRRMAIYGGVRPMLIDRVNSTDEMIGAAEIDLLRRGLVRKGDGLVMVAGVPPNQSASTNLMKLHEVGSGDKLQPTLDA